MKQVGANIYVETDWQGCNPGFVTTSEGVVMIDCPHKPSDAKKWKATVSSKGVVRYLINTEPHIDHITCNYLFPGIVVSHQGTREALQITRPELVLDYAKNLDPQGAHLLEDFWIRMPTVTFTDKMRLFVGEHTLELIHLPGHTSSEIAVHVHEEKVVFVGDNVFCEVQTWLQDALPFEWLESLKKIAALEVDYIIPGHGNICQKDYLKQQTSIIQGWIDVMSRAIDEGMSHEEAAKMISSTEQYTKELGLGNFSPEVQLMNVRRLYDQLKKRKA
ncbi:MAG: MBL fold metallo-hydrolase [Chloroflexota bacterium]|nr:MBL fold metallo-hydrolase [Chloroflexota bacterium]